MPFPSPGDLPDPEIKPRSPALQADALPSEPPGKTDFKPRRDLSMDLEERDLWEPELTAWSQDSLGCGPSQVGAGPCRICVFLLLPASASGLHPSLPPAHRGPLVSTGLGQGQARPGVACKKQAWGQSAD